VVLSDTEVALIEAHRVRLGLYSGPDELNLRYYQGLQRVEQLGMAIPPSMRKFLMIANWCRVVVDTISSRQQLRSFIVPGKDGADPQLREIAAASNLTSHVSMFNTDRMIYGRAFMSVGANETDRSLPLIRVESPREMDAIVDARREVVTSACRFYGWNDLTQASPVEGGSIDASKTTLYLPNATVWAERNAFQQWVEVDRDDHNLGVVPVVMHLNRRLSGSWVGESQMSDVIPLVDGAARSLTNLQFAQEAHGIPRMFMTGVAKGDFIDADGKPIPQFEAYFDAIHMVSDPQGKVGQLEAADLKNFETALRIYGTQASIVTGFPSRYFGLLTTNPPAEGAIHADESTLTRSVEEQNELVGVTLGWVGALALRFAGEPEVPGNRVQVDWFDPSTPTVSQREDALAKRRAAGVLSREGYWDELGWSEARKAKEREYLAAERAEEVDPYLSLMAEKTAAARVVPDGAAADASPVG
jgi:hypothetical protein